jgi:hypothetical protein
MKLQVGSGGDPPDRLQHADGGELVSDPLTYYAEPGVMTTPGKYSSYLDGLPTDIGALCQVVQGVLIHVFWAEQYGLAREEIRRDEVQLRPVADRLQRIVELDALPLTAVREPARRVVGNCRDFTVLLTTILRHQGVPARARCGFGRYFLPDHYEDHWVCECWNAGQQRWVLVDAQLDALQRQALHIAFDPLDVPREQFVVGGKAWQLCRSGQADPESFGILDMHGLWFVRGDLVRDVAALNKVELLPWDSWGLIEGRDEELTSEDLVLLDRVAELTAGDVPQVETVRALYERQAGLRVPATIRSYVHGIAHSVRLFPEHGAGVVAEGARVG